MDLSSILVFIPVLTYAGLMFALKFGKLSSIYLFLTLTIATVILGIISISLIQPIGSGSGMAGLMINVIAVTYILCMAYGAMGVMTNRYERVFVGGFGIVLISLMSAAM